MSPDAPLLHHEPVTAEGADPQRWLYVLHGIFGSGRNWATVARRLVRARPEWGAVLVDLREHGASQGFPPPHTLEACARDLEALVQASGRSTDAVMGHSFGGKVAMTFVSDGAAPAQLWVVDSTPEAGPVGGSAGEMLELLRGLPGPFDTREAGVDALQAQGLALPVAQWMATNLEGDREAGYGWRFDLDAMEKLLHDFARQDLWGLLESPPPGTEIHLIRAEGSGLFAGTALARAEDLVDGERVFLHPVAGGHWVNAENPDALHTLLMERLPEG
jgi:esterase